MTSGDINGVIAVSNSIFVSALPACKPIQKTGKLRSEVGDACEISQEEGIWSVFKINHFSEKKRQMEKINIYFVSISPAQYQVASASCRFAFCILVHKLVGRVQLIKYYLGNTKS